MKKILLAVSLATLGAAAWAQNAPLEGISESTDPAKVRDVERRAEEIRSRQASSSAGASDASATTSDSQGKAHKKSGKHAGKRAQDKGSSAK